MRSKGGVDTLDQICHNPSCERKTRRWPLEIFYNLLNTAGINSLIMYTENMVRSTQKTLSRKQFLFQQCEQLTKPWMQHRKALPTLHRSLRATIEEQVNIAVQQQRCQEMQPDGERTVCYICPAKKRRLPTTSCGLCKMGCCRDHRAVLCANCKQANNMNIKNL